MADKTQKREKALRLKTQAEHKYPTSLKSALRYAQRAQRLCPSLAGISQLVTTFQVLRTFRKPQSSSSSSPNWYEVLNLDPFSPIPAVRSQYKKLALLLHPDKNLSLGADDAFKAIGLAFRVLSDSSRRIRFDADLRFRLRSRAREAGIETFWTACSTCRLYHEFDRKHVGKRLLCPSCKKPFLAVDVGERVSRSDDDDEDDDNVRVSSEKKKNRRSSSASVAAKRKGEIKKEGDNEWIAGSDDFDDEDEDFMLEESLDRKRKVTDSSEKSGSTSKKKVEGQQRRREMTLAEMQLEVIQKMQGKKLKKKKEKERAMVEKVSPKDAVVGNNSKDLMSVEDADFYDFDKDRIERSFKKGQVWAVYDDDDGMPRHYGLIDEVVSVNPFRVRMNWLDLESKGEDALVCLEKLGFHVSCGRFKVGRKIDVDSVNMFSHLVDCERAARDIYRIYPKKGSVWALYSEGTLDEEVGGSKIQERRCYDVVVFLTSYSEMHGLSMAYLEKFEGFKTIFKRREIGCHAIKWLEKDDVRLFSHQIPVKKLSGEEAPELPMPKDCWELDPASLPSDMLTIGWGR